MSKDGILTTIEYLEPIVLNISKSGGHRLVLANELYAYIKPEWIAMNCKVKDSEPHFCKVM